MNGQPTVWQIAGGTADRNYAEEFLRYGVALIGPGDPGRWTPDRDDGEFDGRFVRRFASEVRVGDILLLRAVASRICALGIVASDYVYLDQFEDVNGWPLQHGRRVRWLRLEHEWPTAVFGGQPSRLARTYNEDVICFALRFLQAEPAEWRNAPLPNLPAAQQPLAEIPPEIRSLVSEAERLYPLYWARDQFGGLPSEYELLCHFVVPFLKELGWPAEQIAIEWRNIDVTLFYKLPHPPENVKFVLELKRFGSGIEHALGQAQAYCRALAIERDIVVADGIRYRLYPHDGTDGGTHYANLANLKEPAKELFDALRH